MESGAPADSSAGGGTQSLVPRYYWGVNGPGAGRRTPEYLRGPGYQLYRVVPLDIIQIHVGLGVTEYTPEAVEAAGENLWTCVDCLKRERSNHMTLGGVPISIGLGRARVLELLSAIEDRTGVWADAPLEALIASMQHLGLTRLAVGSRWPDAVNAGLVEYLADADIDVVAITTRGQWAKEAHDMALEDGLRVASEIGREAAAMDGRAEAVFVPGGAAMTLHVVPELEAEFGLPAFTNMTVEIWNGLIRTRVMEPVDGWGRLLAGAESS